MQSSTYGNLSSWAKQNDRLALHWGKSWAWYKSQLSGQLAFKRLAASLASCQCHVPCRKWMQLRSKRKNSVGGQDATMSDEVNWPFAVLTGYVLRTCRRGSVLYFRHVHACPNEKQRALLWTVKRDAFLPPCVQTHSFNCYWGTSVSLLLRHSQAALDSGDFRFSYKVETLFKANIK